MVLRIKKINALYVLLIVPFLVPSSLYIYPIILNLVKMLKLIVFGYCLYLLTGLELREEKVLWYSGIYFVFLLISTMVQGESIYAWFSTVYPYFSVLVLICSWYQRNGERTLDVLANIFIVFLFLNFLSWGMGGLYIDTTSSFGTERMVYFWGIRNSLSYCILPFGIVIFLSLKTQLHPKWNGILGYLAILLNIFLAFSLELVTAIFALCVFALIYIINGNKYRKLPKWNKLLIGILVGTAIGVTGFGFQGNVSIDLLLSLGKGTTFNGRTFIWNSVLSQIKGINWILGHGVGSEKSFEINGMFTATTHSQYLYILYESGLIGIVLFWWMIYGQLKPLFKKKFRSGNKIIFAGIVCILAAGIVENICNNCYFFSMLGIVSCYINEKKYDDEIDALNTA